MMYDIIGLPENVAALVQKPSIGIVGYWAVGAYGDDVLLCLKCSKSATEYTVGDPISKVEAAIRCTEYADDECDVCGECLTHLEEQRHRP